MERKDFTLSIKLTFIILFGMSLFWFLFSCQLLWAYDPGGAPLDLKKNSRMNDTILIQPGTGTSGGSATARFRTYYGTQACVGVGSNGYLLSGTLTGVPCIDYLYGNGSSTLNFSGFTHIAIGGSDIPSASSVTGKIDAVGGTGTTNILTDTTLAGNVILPSGIWNSSGNVGIGTTTPAQKLSLSSGDSVGIELNKTGANYASLFFNKDGIREYVVQTRGDITSPNLVFRLSDTTNVMTLDSGGNVGIGTAAPSNILTLPIASATDPIADAWTVHCLSEYKDIGTETTKMIQTASNEKIKTVPVSSFTKKAIISDEEAEREVKQKYQGKIRESAKADLELYTTETGVAMRDNSYVDELLNSMWETKSDRVALVETNRQKLIAEKKALPKFQRQNYGIVAEDAPSEAQVRREDGSLQGVDPYSLIGILWANAQKQEERITYLETQIGSLTSRLRSAGIP